MSNIVVNAPIQNKDFYPDDQLGKVIPLFAGDWLRRRETDMESPIELWNNVIASEQIAHTADSYDHVAGARLAQKYGSNLLGSLHHGMQPVVMTDSDTAFTTWASGIITASVEAGDLQIKPTEAFVCTGCDGALAVASGPQPACCPNCPAAPIVTDNPRLLIGTLDRQSYSRVDEATNSLSPPVAERIFIANKRRLGGISLRTFGFENDMLDPRIGLGLLIAYSAIVNNADTVSVVASQATLRQNLAHYYAATASQLPALPSTHMRGIAKAPANYLMYLRNEDIISRQDLASLLINRIVPRLFTMHKDMSPLAAEQLIFSRRQSASID